MLYPKPLVNYYYFIKSNVVFNISPNNDADQCGVHYVEYVTETKSLQEGDTYYDNTNTLQKADAAGNKEVSTGIMDDTKNAVIFPNVKVVVKDDKDVEQDPYYFWYQYLISDGDTYSGGKFVYSHKNDGEGEDYLSVVAESVTKDIETMVSKGYTLDAIKATLPWWVTGKADDKVVIGGKLYTIVTNNFSSNFQDTEITKLIQDKINEMVIDYTNLTLKKHGQKLTKCTDKLIDFDKDVVDIDDDESDNDCTDD